MPTTPAVVALTDSRWFEFLRSRAVDGRLDEVNFWRPMGAAFRAFEPGGPFFFRLKHPVNAIVGYGYFTVFQLLPVQMAWLTFAEKNGDATYDGFLNRIAEYRHQSPAETAIASRPVACIILREVRFLAEHDWVPWGIEQDWHRNVQVSKGYDLATGPGLKVRDLLRNGKPAELAPGLQVTDGQSFAGKQDVENRASMLRIGTRALVRLQLWWRRCGSLPSAGAP